MLKSLFIFRAGIAVAGIATFFIGYHLLINTEIDTPAIGSKPPVITNTFLGDSERYTGNYLRKKKGVLASGPGKIQGTVSIDGQPVKGVKLRLALPDYMMSRWTSSNKTGEYSVSVPYGQYKIHGFELDSESADNLLPGLIHSPLTPHSTGPFHISENKLGTGIHFNFIKPVTKYSKEKAFNLGDSVTIAWHPYEGASSYLVQVYEHSNPEELTNRRKLFTWSDQPDVEETTIDLSAYTDKLKSGNLYTYEIRARNQKRRQISRSTSSHDNYDFKIN